MNYFNKDINWANIDTQLSNTNGDLLPRVGWGRGGLSASSALVCHRFESLSLQLELMSR